MVRKTDPRRCSTPQNDREARTTIGRMKIRLAYQMSNLTESLFKIGYRKPRGAIATHDQGQDRPLRLIGLTNKERLISVPPPPNRSGGFPAHGSPVSGLTPERIDRPVHWRSSSYIARAWQRMHWARHPRPGRKPPRCFGIRHSPGGPDGQDDELARRHRTVQRRSRSSSPGRSAMRRSSRTSL